MRSQVLYMCWSASPSATCWRKCTWSHPQEKSLNDFLGPQGAPKTLNLTEVQRIVSKFHSAWSCRANCPSPFTGQSGTQGRGKWGLESRIQRSYTHQRRPHSKPPDYAVSGHDRSRNFGSCVNRHTDEYIQLQIKMCLFSTPHGPRENG